MAFLLIALPKKINSNKNPTPNPQLTQNQKVENQSSLTVTQPEENALVTSEEVEISGQTVPNAKIIISGPTLDIVQTSDNQGKFSAKINVFEGENLISVTAYSEDGKVFTVNRKIFYSQENL